MIGLINQQWSLPPLGAFLSPVVIHFGICDFPSVMASELGGGDTIS